MPKAKDGNHLLKKATNLILNLELFRCKKPVTWDQPPVTSDQNPALLNRDTANFLDVGYPFKYFVDTVLL